jgi:trans-L-3-hydroxyproline dehydratase
LCGFTASVKLSQHTSSGDAPLLTVKTIDAHVGGEPLRLVVDGFPAPRGKTMAEKQEWAASRADHLRRAVMLEPRGHADMSGAVLTEPVSPGSHAGILFIDADGFASFAAHGIIAATTIALERGLLMPGGDGRAVVFDTIAGTVRAVAAAAPAAAAVPVQAAASGAEPIRVAGVTFTGVPAFVVHGGIDVPFGTRRLRVDLSFGGGFYAIIDAESAGLPLTAAFLPELRRATPQIVDAIERVVTLVHPNDPRLTGIAGVVFTGPAAGSSADLRNVTVSAGGRVDRSASGAATAAVMAVLDAMGLVDEERDFVQESVVGTTITSRLAGRTQVGDFQAIVPEISGRAWITGEHTFFAAADDPFGYGLSISDF